MTDIYDYGWNEWFQEKWDSACKKSGAGSGIIDNGLRKARVITDHGQMLRVFSGDGEFLVNRPKAGREGGREAGREVGTELPGQLVAAGDWVALDDNCQISFVLPRRTKFSRAAAGQQLREQVVAANADYVFIVQSLNRDFNIRRLERYLIAAWESGAVPVVILTKTDICEDVAAKLAEVYAAAPGAEVLAVSCLTGQGLAAVGKYLVKGKTIALLGSSGVGKSTLVNTLAGEELLKTREIREDDSRGRHTTTHRELILMPQGGLILDTPGMRSLSLWEADTGMEVMFGDVEELAGSCRFFDCTHGNEPGCAVREALERGTLEPGRWESWLKLQKEMTFLDAKKEGRLRLLEKQWGKSIAKAKKGIF
ncbi:MAG: ribosome small subunit-dependent GTPase A [Clostridiales bacterium]|nr:ribosome small subunit-dependent GTPase A [Clostridiales bacterium]